MRVQPLLKVLAVGGTLGAFIAGAPPSSGAARARVVAGAPPARVFVVNSDGDDPDPDAGQPDDDDVCATVHNIPPPDAECTLRAAIQNHDANRHLGQNEIRFNIPLPVVGPASIQVGATGLGPLPMVRGSCVIDGTTQPVLAGPNLVEIDGQLAGGGANGLELRGGESVLRGLVINRFAGHGILVSGTGPPGAGGHQIFGCRVGTDFDGLNRLGNGGDGIRIERGTPDTTIGGPAQTERNLISGNTGNGITLELVGFLNRQTLTRIRNNFIGTDLDGMNRLGNGGQGIQVVMVEAGDGIAAQVVIGGDLATLRNLISGNSGSGIVMESDFVEEPVTNVRVQGNYIGTDVAGAAALGNAGTGIALLRSVEGVLLGGFKQEEGNVISGNLGNGVRIAGPHAAGNFVVFNRIGTDAAAGNAVANGINGVFVDDAPGNFIGLVTLVPGQPQLVFAGNVISGNLGDGLRIAGTGATQNVAEDNTIGSNIPNAGDGVFILRASVNTIGGIVMAENAGNFIADNGSNGVHIEGPGAGGNRVLANLIGTNILDGVRISVAANTIVGGAGGLGNILVANGGAGLHVDGQAASGNQVDGNQMTGNTLDGVLIEDAPGNRIGSAATPNQIGNNQRDGVRVTGATATGNVIRGNSVFGNTDGVRVTGATATGNLIRGNSVFNNTALGIDLAGDGVTPNDPGDTDAGPNDRQNFPVLTSAFTTTPPVPPNPVTTVTGSLSAALPTAPYTLEFFDNPICDPSGFGEGDVSLGTAGVVTDVTGNASFTLPFPAIMAGRFITATATAPNQSTSEFSRCIEVQLGGPVIVTIEATDPQAAEPPPGGATGAFKLTRTGNIDLLSPLAVRISVGGTATSGLDYVDLGTIATIPIGQVSVTLTVTPLLDALTEGPETVVVTVQPGVAYQPGTPNTATVTIADRPPGVDCNLPPFCREPRPSRGHPRSPGRSQGPAPF